MLVVRIEREEKRNAIDQAIADGIGAALDRLDDDPELWVGVHHRDVDGVLRRERPRELDGTGARAPNAAASTA